MAHDLNQFIMFRDSTLRPARLLSVCLLLLAASASVAVAALSPLASPPDWSDLDRYQHTITRADFLAELDGIYAPNGAWRSYLTLANDHVDILRSSSGEKNYYRLHFAKPGKSDARPSPYWQPRSNFSGNPPDKPLQGVHIAIDPGHIGGNYARMEERWFQLPGNKPVIEGEMTLFVAKLLDDQLTALGAKVSLIRSRNSPVTRLRPADLTAEAAKELRRLGINLPASNYRDHADPKRKSTLRWHSELLFYRTAEIRARAELVNNRLKPDLVIALHFNAEPWGEPAQPSLTKKKHLHLLVNGTYSRGEVGLDDNRFEMILRILQGIHNEEVILADNIATTLAKATRLPPYVYLGSNARRVSNNKYVYARNLLANRIYLCPVAYLEPYVMNSHDAHLRIQLGAYDGVRTVNGVKRPSIFKEYATAVTAGVVSHFRNN